MELCPLPTDDYPVKISPITWSFATPMGTLHPITAYQRSFQTEEPSGFLLCLMGYQISAIQLQRFREMIMGVSPNISSSEFYFQHELPMG